MDKYYINQIVRVPEFYDSVFFWPDTMFMITVIDHNDEERKYAIQNHNEIKSPYNPPHWPLTTQIKEVLSY